jgi:hypothetical protein
VQLINTQNLVLVGPGSEWFWTAVSGLVLAITFLAIYRQLRLQRDTAAIEQVAEMERSWTSERMVRSKLAVLLAIEAGTAPADIPDKAATHIGDFWERLGYLARTGRMSRRFVYDQWGGVAPRWWARLLPSTLAWRERDQEPRIWSDFEWLARMMVEMDGKGGVAASLDPESLARQLPFDINQAREAVEIEVELRTMTVRLAPLPIPFPVMATWSRAEQSVAARTPSTGTGTA